MFDGKLQLLAANFLNPGDLCNRKQAERFLHSQ